jgi:hypothetical protein
MGEVPADQVAVAPVVDLVAVAALAVDLVVVAAAAAAAVARQLLRVV